MSTATRTLIVDDDPDVHSLLVAALAAPDRQIDSAYDGLAGLRMIEESHYDVVLTDVNMPGLDGLALLERIRETRPSTRVVVMTVANTPDNIVRAIRQRAFSYFSKPFTLNSVVDMVEQALGAPASTGEMEVLSASRKWLEIRLNCKIETADRILQFLREMETNLPAAERENVAMAFREILLNAIEHGAGADPTKKVNITYIRGERALFYRVRDPGPGFSLEKLAHAAISNPVESPFEHTEVRKQLGLRPGGFGILMSRKFVDEMIYNEAGNEVLLIKYLD
jgi:CheY-like chemotaxis protein/anti-sigma regulatory factor (Ser/Thr protein kinase)